MSTVGSIISGGFRLLTENLGAVMIWAGLQFAVGVASQYWIISQVEAAGVSPGSASFIGAAILLVVISTLVGVVVQAASYRAVLRPSEGGPGFLRLGMDELRLIGLFLIFIVVGGIAGFLIVLLVMFLTAGGSFASGGSIGAAVGIFGILYLALFLGVIFLAVRLSLCAPLTVLRRRIVIDESWSLTRGRFWKLFAAYFVIGVVTIILYMLAAIPASGPQLTQLFQGMANPELFAQFAQSQALQPTMAMIMVGAAVNAIAQAIGLALGSGASSTAVREFLLEEGEATDEDVHRTAEIFE